MLTIRPARVGYVVKRYPRYSETFIVNEILAHEASGLDVQIFSLRPPIDQHFQDRISRVRAPVHYLSSDGAKASAFWTAIEQTSRILPRLWDALEMARGESVSDIHQAVLLAREAHQNDIGHLHAHFATSAATVTRLAAHFAGLPFTITAHAKDIFHENVDPDDLRRKLHDAAAVVTVSDYNLQHLRETYGNSANRVERVYNGLDLDEYCYQPPIGREPRIIAVGRLIEKKGFAVLIDACSILAKRGRDFRCQIIGTGELETDLRTRIERLGLHERVELLGPRPQVEVIQLVQSAQVLAAPCVVGTDGNRDGLPTVLVEAMALGTPCVSTDVTGIPEAVHHEVTGLIVRQHDATALADAIERLLGDEGFRHRLSQRARRMIEEEFDIHRNTARLRQIFGTVPSPRTESLPIQTREAV